jgi:hypothetical protein
LLLFPSGLFQQLIELTGVVCLKCDFHGVCPFLSVVLPIYTVKFLSFCSALPTLCLGARRLTFVG